MDWGFSWLKPFLTDYVILCESNHMKTYMIDVNKALQNYGESYRSTNSECYQGDDVVFRFLLFGFLGGLMQYFLWLHKDKESSVSNWISLIRHSTVGWKTFSVAGLISHPPKHQRSDYVIASRRRHWRCPTEFVSYANFWIIRWESHGGDWEEREGAKDGSPIR